MRAFVPMYNSIKSVVNFFSKQLHFDKYKSQTGRKLAFWGYARSNLINEEACRLLSGVNVKRLIFGLESGSGKILAYLKKSVKVVDNQRAVGFCRRFGITTSSGFIAGTPGETVEDLREIYQFMKEYPLDNTQVYFFNHLSWHSGLASGRKKGWVAVKTDFSQLFVWLPVLKLINFFRVNRSHLLTGRIFLNSKQQNNPAHLRLIFKLIKLAYQNLLFYIKVLPQNLALAGKVIFLKIKKALVGQPSLNCIKKYEEDFN